MRRTTVKLAAFALYFILMNLGFSAKADTVKVRCDFYPKGEDKASASEVCTFSQRQGNISIQRQNGTRYELSPVGDEPGNFKDKSGEEVYRQSGLGDRGSIFRMSEESIYIYWDTAPFSSGEDPETMCNPAEEPC